MKKKTSKPYPSTMKNSQKNDSHSKSTPNQKSTSTTVLTNPPPKTQQANSQQTLSTAQNVSHLPNPTQSKRRGARVIPALVLLVLGVGIYLIYANTGTSGEDISDVPTAVARLTTLIDKVVEQGELESQSTICLLYTSPSPRD